MKKAALTFLASKLPEKCIEDLRNTFISIDVNGDGRIQFPELKKALSTVGVEMTKEEADELMSNLDLNDNGSIDYTEFLAGCMRSKIYLKEDHLRAAFEFFDKVRD